MNTRFLEYVLTLAEAGHFGRAAERAGVSQPTLSTQVAKLEAELGVRLFERGASGVRATPAGKRVVARARRVLDEVEALRAEARADPSRWAGSLRLGVIPTAGPYLMPHVLPTVRRAQPEAELLIRESTTRDLLDRLGRTDLDAAIVSRPFDDAGLVTTPLCHEPFVLAVPRGHALAELDAVRTKDLRAGRLLLLEDGHCLRDQTLDLCRTRSGGRARGGEAKAEAFQASSLESLRQMVAAGNGVTLLPWLATPAAPGGRIGKLRGVVYRPFEPPPPARSLVLAWRRSFPAGAVMQRLGAALRETLEAVVPASP
ncbi:MAG: LysR substrate-binding domain-containing protein [Planctomycetota bacterium]